MDVSTLADLLPAAANRNADGPAIRDQASTTSWQDAHQRAGRISAALNEVGVGPGDRVGVHLRKSADAFLAMHAVVGIGAIAVPLDPTASDHYLSSVVTQTGTEVVVSHEPCRGTASSLARSGLRAMIGIDADPDATSDPAMEVGPGGTRCVHIGPEAINNMDPLDGRVAVDPGDAAYIITTSGSTGRPKGICHTHASALAYVQFKLAAYDFGPDDRISDIAPNHFDISTQALWVTPRIGATNIVIPEQYQLFPASLSQLIAEEALTVWYGVPYQLTQLLARGALEERDLSSLRWVLFGGEVFPPQTLARLMRQLPSSRFSNVYGPAEVNACAIHHLQAPPVGETPIPVGCPVADTEIRLVDPDSLTDASANPRLVAAGETGEIWVTAATMMTGYWERPDLDAASIVQWDGDRWYRTGDVGMRNDDGHLVFMGRLDHQVKVRGYRVELESIESVLEDVDGVINAIAAVARSEDGSDEIIAGLITEPDVVLDDNQLTEWAREHLPLYAVPKTFYPVGSKPVTGSGKLDRRTIRTGILNVHQGGEGTQHV